MAQLTNSPQEVTILRLKARKSFALGIFIADSNGHPLDITGATLRFVMRKPQIPLSVTDDSGNLIVTALATIQDPVSGYAVFNLQASELEDPPGEYAYSITLIHEGYSAVVVEGPLELEQNTEFTSTQESYSTTGPPQALKVLMREQKAIRVYAGYVLPPGTQHFTDEDDEKLQGIETGAERNVNADWNAQQEDGDSYILNKPVVLLPPGGVPPEVLTKRSAADGDAIWTMPQTGGDLIVEEDPTDPLLAIPVDDDDLSSEGVPPNYSPVSDGNGSWFWAPIVGAVTSVNTLIGDVVLDLDTIPDTATRLAMTPAERQIIASLGSGAQIPVSKIPHMVLASNGALHLGTNATSPSSTTGGHTSAVIGGDTATVFYVRREGTTRYAIDETGKITIGNADVALITTGVFAAARLPRIGSILGNTSGTAVPTGGSDGDEYFQYT